MTAILENITRWDLDVLLFIQANIRTAGMTPFWKTITLLGNAGWFWILTAVVLLFSAKTRRTGILAIVSMAIGFLIVNLLLKNMVARIRPYEVEPALVLLGSKARDFSFPSGHSCVSFACASSIWRTMKKPWGCLAVILAALIAFSRLYIGIHYPTDVIFGVLSGVFSGWLAWKLISLWEKRKGKDQNV